jgi:hypothetical protein
MTEKKKPAVQTELDKAQEQLDTFESQVKELTIDRMNQASLKEQEPQTKLSSQQIDAAKQTYLKPKRSISAKDKFNEKYRDEYEFAKEYVQFIAEHREIIGETIEIWTRRYAGLPAEYWEVPVNKPVWGPRYLAEQIRKCRYHRLSMEEKYTSDNFIGSSGLGAMYGKIVVENTIQRLNAEPVSPRKSVFMGSEAFAA